MHVLLVDDDARLVELLATYLTPNGVRLTLAEDGPRGWLPSRPRPSMQCCWM